MLCVLQDHLDHDLKTDSFTSTDDKTNTKQTSRTSKIANIFSSLLNQHPFTTPTLQDKFKLHHFEKIFGRTHPQKQVNACFVFFI